MLTIISILKKNKKLSVQSFSQAVFIFIHLTYFTNMKTKLYQLLVLLPLCSGAQSIHSNSQQAENEKNPAPSDRAQIVQEEVIGFSYYDLQWKGSSPTRVVNNSDGTISACCTFSPNANANYPDRQVWYTYFNGFSWAYDTSASTGPALFPAIAVTPLFQEMIFLETDSGIVLKHRPVKGTGPWFLDTTSFGVLPTYDTQPRVATGGSNQQTVHAIWSAGGNHSHPVAGQTHPIVYSRSMDGGLTWPVSSIILPAIDSSHYLGFTPGSYSIDCKDNIVAIAYGDPKTDVGLLKSTDGGNTWISTIVHSFPIPFFDPVTMITDTNTDAIADTLDSNGGDPFVLIDNSGVCHVWYSRLKVVCSQPGTQPGEGLLVDPYSDGLCYWKDTWMPNSPVQIAAAEDLSGNQRIDYPFDQFCSLPFGNYGGGLTQFPSAGIDASDNLYVSYQTISELSDTLVWKQSHRHVYSISSADHGQTWGTPVDIIPSSIQGGDGEVQEGVYPSMARVAAIQNPTIVYQRDMAPGISFAEAGTCDQVNNNLSFNDLIVVQATVLAVSENLKSKTTESIIAYPNPSNSMIHFEFSKVPNENIILTLRNNLGQLVMEKSFIANTSDYILDISKLPAGIYTCTAQGNDLQLVKKIIVE